MFSLLSVIMLWFTVFAFFRLTKSNNNRPKSGIVFHAGHEIVFYIAVFLVVSLCQAKFIEPRNEIDRIMHIEDGKLPDLQILEEEEPVDAILLWGKKAAKDHHPIVREKIYWDLLEKTCLEIEGVDCKRRRAWEYIDMGVITVNGQAHKIDYYNPSVDPNSRRQCGPDSEGRKNCIMKTAMRVCRRIIPPISNCLLDLTKHMLDQLNSFEESRLKKKDTYTKLGLEMDAPHEELFPAAAGLIRERKINISPYRRVDNGTESFPRWDKHSSEAFHVMDMHKKIEDNESREWNDKPCTPYFGGAMCAKTDKDGNMMIEVDS